MVTKSEAFQTVMCTKEKSKSDTGVRQHEAVLTTPLLPLCGSKKTKLVLSLGRLHPLKGLDLLISAFAEIKRSSKVLKCEPASLGATPSQGSSKVEEGETPRQGAAVPSETPRQGEALPWQLVIAGPDEQGTKGKLKEISEKLKIRTADASDLSDASDADIVFVGAVQGEEKWNLIKKADIFVLPSRSENFGIVVGEALSCGVPVVTTAVGPWGEGKVAVGSSSRQLGERSASFANRTPAAREVEGDCPLPLPTAHWGLLVVETSVEGIAEGLQQMMALSDEERQEMGQQGCEWVKREFSWEHVAKQMVEAYEEGRAAARPCRGGINEPRGLSVGRGEL